MSGFGDISSVYITLLGKLLEKSLQWYKLTFVSRKELWECSPKLRFE